MLRARENAEGLVVVTVALPLSSTAHALQSPADCVALASLRFFFFDSARGRDPIRFASSFLIPSTPEDSNRDYLGGSRGTRSSVGGGGLSQIRSNFVALAFCRSPLQIFNAPE